MRARLLGFYAVVTALFGMGIAVVLDIGERLQPLTESEVMVAASSSLDKLDNVLLDNLKHPLGLLILQIIVIISAAKLCGLVFARLKQPAVIGEMLAGIMLGPSLLGLVAPDVKGFLFPASSLGILQMLSQIGVILFMFLVGLELDLSSLRKRAQAAVVVSHASIVVPFFLGAVFSLLLYSTLTSADFTPSQISFTAFSLFMGTAMSVTAFPVLARIIEERGLTGSHLGMTAIACAAVDDVTAWCILAVVVAIAKAQGMGGALLTITLAVAFIAAMLLLAKPRLATFVEGELPSEKHKKNRVVAVLVFVLASALFTEVIGIHALFGAFLAGAVMPPHAPLSRVLKERIETFASVFLLPLFFAFTGLRTQIGLLDGWESWALCGLVIAVATAGKFGGSTLAARWSGLRWSDSAAIGALMNTRGLMELIALNIGYDLGILSPRIFTMMVIMALVTTFMTGPLLSWIEFLKRRQTLDRTATLSG